MNSAPVVQLHNATPGTRTVGIRPEHAQLSDSGPLSLVVSQVEQLGSTSVLRGNVVPDAPFEIILNGQASIRCGETVRVSVPPEHVHCFDQNGLRL